MDYDRLLIIVSRLTRFLEWHRVRYASVLAELTFIHSDHPEFLKEEIRKLFGGMGSLTDICISKDNKHRVEHEQEANFELDALTEVLWEEVIDPDRDIIPQSAMHLVRVFPQTHEVVEDAFAEDNLKVNFLLLIRITYFDSDWQWVQDWCLYYTYHSNPCLRGVAVACLADLCKLHRKLELVRVLPRLEELLTDPEVRERAEKALSDISIAGVRGQA